MLSAILLLVIALAMCAQSAYATENFSTVEMQYANEKLLKRYNAVGAAIIVAKNGKIEFEQYYGYASKKGNRPVTETTHFRLASVTKMVSAIRVMQLVEAGKLDLDRDISEYLGYTVRNLYYPETPITLRMLMSHTSSLREEGAFSKGGALRGIVAQESRKWGCFYKEVPGSVYRYSNFGAGIMGSLIETITQKNVNESVVENVFRPLGIDAAYSASLLEDKGNVCALYKADGKQVQSAIKAVEEKWDTAWNPEMHYRVTVGSLWMRPRDLCKIGMLLCNGGEYQGTRLLREETVNEMKSSQTGKPGVTAKTIYGLCVNRVPNLIKGKMFYGHQGMNNGTLCNVYFDPDTNFVFVFVSNGCDNHMSDRIGYLSRKIFEIMYATYGY